MSKVKGDSTWRTLKRLHSLIELLAESGSRGATWERIRDEIYPGDASEPTKKRMFYNDRKRLLYTYDDIEDGLEPEEDLTDEDLTDKAIVERGRDGRYTIRSGMNFMLPMRLTDEQALALTSSVRLVPSFLPPFKEASDELWEKLKRPLPREIRDKAEALTEAIVPAIPMSKDLRKDKSILPKILDAIERKKILEVKSYDKAREDDLRSCSFSPRALYLKHHSWYVMGEVHDDQGDRAHILRVDRIRSADVLEKDQPHPCEGKDLEELERDIRLDLDPFDKRAPKGGYRVKLRILGSFVRPCMETEWFPGEKKTLGQDGTLDYEVTLKGLESIALWIMRALDSVEVIEPAELRERIDERVKKYTDRAEARPRSRS